MMAALLFHSCCRGSQSSREIAQHCHERMDFMAVTACHYLDFRTAAAFRQRPLSVLGGQFDQTLDFCGEMGLASLGHVPPEACGLRNRVLKCPVEIAGLSAHNSLSVEDVP